MNQGGHTDTRHKIETQEVTDGHFFFWKSFAVKQNVFKLKHLRANVESMTRFMSQISSLTSGPPESSAAREFPDTLQVPK